MMSPGNGQFVGLRVSEHGHLSGVVADTLFSDKDHACQGESQHPLEFVIDPSRSKEIFIEGPFELAVNGVTANDRISLMDSRLECGVNKPALVLEGPGCVKDPAYFNGKTFYIDLSDTFSNLHALLKSCFFHSYH